jgi:hypothetical protein
MSTEQTVAAQPAEQPEQNPAPEVVETAAPEAAAQPAEEPKPEPEDDEKLPSWAKKKLRNMERSMRHAQRKLGAYEERLQSPPEVRHNQDAQDDSEPVSLSRQELERLVQQEARKLAPVLKDQETVIEHRRRVAEGLAKEWGPEGFDRRSQDLDAAFGGLTQADRSPKPAVDAIFEAEKPAAIIEYLTDPDNASEAEAIARMSAVQAGRAIARLEFKLGAKPADKPQPSKAPAPIEPERGQGKIERDPSQMTDAEFIAWRRKQIAQRF